MAITCYNIAADCYVDTSGNRQKEIMGSCGALFLSYFYHNSWAPGLLGSWAPGLLVCRRKLHGKVTQESYIKKLHLMLAL